MIETNKQNCGWSIRLKPLLNPLTINCPCGQSHCKGQVYLLPGQPVLVMQKGRKIWLSPLTQDAVVGTSLN